MRDFFHFPLVKHSSKFCVYIGVHAYTAQLVCYENFPIMIIFWALAQVYQCSQGKPVWVWFLWSWQVQHPYTSCLKHRTWMQTCCSSSAQLVQRWSGLTAPVNHSKAGWNYSQPAVMFQHVLIMISWHKAEQDLLPKGQQWPASCQLSVYSRVSAQSSSAMHTSPERQQPHTGLCNWHSTGDCSLGDADT